MELRSKVMLCCCSAGESPNTPAEVVVSKLGDKVSVKGIFRNSFFLFYCPMSIIWDLEQSCSSLRTAGFRFQRRQHSSGKLKEIIQVHNQSFSVATASCCRADSRLPLQPSPCQHILQRSCVPAVELSAELEVRSPAAGWGRPQQGGAVRGG